MGYTSRYGRRPAEYASKSSHSQVINDPVVQDFLTQCSLPKRAEDVSLPANDIVKCEPVARNPVRHVIAIDGGYTEVVVRTEFPSATICFFQFGALTFSIEDLETLEEQPFIDPDDMAKHKQIQRLKLTLPVRNVTLKSERTLTHSVRQALYDFFRAKLDEGHLIDTLRWLVFQEFGETVPTWTLSTCPHCGVTGIPLHRAEMAVDYTFPCSQCEARIFLTDVMRLHEAIDDELGAGGILGYVTTAVEQLVLVHMIRLILKIKPALLDQVLFVKDGPLAFFGQTANLHKPMRVLVQQLNKKHNLLLAGLEKSGPFIEHANEIASELEPGTALILGNNYIYSYIIPGKADPANPYGNTTYYGNKLIFKTNGGGIHVVTLPTEAVLPHPKVSDFKDFQVILHNIDKLKCDMYDNALIPIALANKLVSLANHPSSKILQKFAVGTIQPG